MNKLNKRFLCSQFGQPISINSTSGGRETWRYPNGTITLHGEHVIASHLGKTSIGG